jgi:starch synthase
MSAAIWYEREAYRTDGPKLMGRQAAGKGFLDGLIRHTSAERLTAVAKTKSEGDEFIATVHALRPDLPVTIVPIDGLGAIANTGTLYYPGPLTDRLAWARRHFQRQTWSLCGVTHTIASSRATETIARWLTAPLEPWDAVVCTSKAVHAAVARLIEAKAQDLKERIGATRFTVPRLPIIPLGVDCAAQASAASNRDAARARHGIAPSDFVVVFVGRLAFHAKAHPLPMYLALERLAGRHRVVLVECGWAANEAVTAVFDETRGRLCPSVRSIVLDGRKPEEVRCAWAVADVFCSLSDNIQETFGLAPIEAMAAAVPCVVADWNGYRDTVRNGIDGFTVRTLTPPPGTSIDLAYAHVMELDTYDMLLARTSMLTAVDVEATVVALRMLADDPELRRRLGTNAAKHARENYDWEVVIRAYEALWTELAEARRAGGSPTASSAKALARWPEHPDPFDLFADYPSARLAPSSHLRLLPDAETDAFATRIALRLNKLPHPVVSAQRLTQLRDNLREGVMTVQDVLSRFTPVQQREVLRGIMVLAKFGLIAVAVDGTSKQPVELRPTQKEQNE